MRRPKPQRVPWQMQAKIDEVERQKRRAHAVATWPGEPCPSCAARQPWEPFCSDCTAELDDWVARCMPRGI